MTVSSPRTAVGVERGLARLRCFERLETNPYLQNGSEDISRSGSESVTVAVFRKMLMYSRVSRGLRNEPILQINCNN
jgi:hypothetical protein